MEAEVAEVKDGGWLWDLVLLEVVIETSSRSPEVSNATGSADASSGHEHNVAKPPLG